jgi:hypothetical protein
LRDARARRILLIVDHRIVVEASAIGAGNPAEAPATYITERSGKIRSKRLPRLLYEGRRRRTLIVALASPPA